MAEFSQPSWLKTTNPIFLPLLVCGKRLKENVNPGFPFWQSTCFSRPLNLESFEAEERPSTKEQ
jgi:hypothetical protein